MRPKALELAHDSHFSLTSSAIESDIFKLPNEANSLVISQRSWRSDLVNRASLSLAHANTQ
jgi:hypothetical protein